MKRRLIKIKRQSKKIWTIYSIKWALKLKKLRSSKYKKKKSQRRKSLSKFSSQKRQNNKKYKSL